MNTNEGALDRGFRIILGLVLIGLAATGRWAPWGWIGVLPLITGVVGICPLYQLLGIKTCPVKIAIRSGRALFRRTGGLPTNTGWRVGVLADGLRPFAQTFPWTEGDASRGRRALA